MATALVPLRKSLPAAFDDVQSIQNVTFNVQNILQIAAATAIGGPAGGALEFGRQALTSPNTQAAAITAYCATGAANNLLEVLKTLDDFIGNSEVEALERIALALGQKTDGPEIDPTAVATSLAEIRRGVARPPAATDPPGTPTTYIVDCLCKKKVLKGVEFAIEDFPANNKRHTLKQGGVFALSCGYVFWTVKGKRIPQQQWLNNKYNLCVAPLDACDGYDFYIYPGVRYTKTDVEIEVHGCF